MFVSWILYSTFTRSVEHYAEFSTCLTAISSNFQVYAILDEVFLAGEIEETSKEVVLSRLEELEKLE
jgi:AP-2 complex subunit sigma-1